MEVVSVSASDDEADFVAPGTLATYSNAGAVMMPGVWGRELGTSFAAPRYSYAMALILLGVTPTGCSASPTAALPDDWSTSPPVTPNQPMC